MQNTNYSRLARPHFVASAMQETEHEPLCCVYAHISRRYSSKEILPVNLFASNQATNSSFTAGRGDLSLDIAENMDRVLLT